MEYCDIHTTLERAGLSKTSQRVAVLTALVHAQTPLSAKDILDRVSGDSRVNKVTVYRILSSFKAGSIIREIATDHGVTTRRTPISTAVSAGACPACPNRCSARAASSTS